jgi:hypothetical protein
MGLSIRSFMLTCALLWGGCMLVVGLINLADPSYGGEFLRMMSSVYPGADTARTLGRVVLGAIYGFVDGAIAGCLFGWIYRGLNGHGQAVHAHL